MSEVEEPSVKSEAKAESSPSNASTPASAPEPVPAPAPSPAANDSAKDMEEGKAAPSRPARSSPEPANSPSNNNAGANAEGSPVGTLQDFIARKSAYQQTKTEGVLALQTWHDKLLLFFSSQRAPYVQKLDNMQVRVRNGERALSEAKRLLTFQMDTYLDMYKRFRATTVFNTPLEKIPTMPGGGHNVHHGGSGSLAIAAPSSTSSSSTPTAAGAVPPTTLSPPGGAIDDAALAASGQQAASNTGGTTYAIGDLPIPEGGAVDPSVLALSVVASMTFQSGEKARIMADQIKAAIVSVNTLAKAYGQKAQGDIEKMKTLVKQCEQATLGVDQSFKAHLELFNFYSRAVALGHSAGGPSASVAAASESVTQLMSPSRKDMWRSEMAYRERVVSLTKLHEGFFTQCSALLEDHSAAEQQRALKLHAILSDTVFNYSQYHASLHRLSANTQTEVQQCLVTANRNHQRAKQQQALELQRQQASSAVAIPPGSSEAKTAAVSAAAAAPPPGPFPTNLNVVLAGAAERRTKLLKNWKPVYLVLTKDNFLHCYSIDDLDTSAEVDKFLGPSTSGSNAGLVTTPDPRQSRFVLKSTKSVENAEVWTADVYETTASLGDGKDEGLAAQGLVFNISVVPTAFFASSWTSVLRLRTKEETQMWINAINEHKKV